MTKEYGEVAITMMSANKADSAGREIGYMVCFRDNGTDFRAYVQNARRVNGEWVEFGVKQRSKSFTSQASAVSWAYKAAKERITKLK